MNSPRVTPKRLYWSLLLAAAVWSYFGVRSEAQLPAPDKSGMKRVQEFFTTKVTVLLVPPEFVFNLAQGLAVSAIERVRATRPTGATPAELEARIRDLTDKNTYLQGQLEEAQQRLAAYDNMLKLGVKPGEMLLATRTGFGAGAPSVRIHLDKGSMDGVQEKMVIVDPHEQVTALGRIAVVSAKDSYAVLLPDPAEKVYAQILHNGAPINEQPTLFEGIGGDSMRCGTLDVRGVAAVPQPGDLVRLYDAQWPACTKYMVIGQVTDVRYKESQALRYEVTMEMRLPPAQIQQVMIILKN